MDQGYRLTEGYLDEAAGGFGKLTIYFAPIFHRSHSIYGIILEFYLVVVSRTMKNNLLLNKFNNFKM